MIKIIAATTLDGVISIDGELPAKLSDDLKHFKTTTYGRTVVFGRKTLESMRQAFGERELLPGRKKIVFTRNPQFSDKNCEVCSDVQTIIDRANKEDVFIIGGGEIYKLFFPYAQEIILTCIGRNTEGVAGEKVYFPEINHSEWSTNGDKLFFKSAGNEFNFSITTYKKNM